jgi:hypothetical protein
MESCIVTSLGQYLLGHEPLTLQLWLPKLDTVTPEYRRLGIDDIKWKDDDVRSEKSSCQSSPYWR